MITSEWPTPAHPERAPFIVQQVRSIRQAGIDVTVFPFRGNKNPVNYLKAWLKLRIQHKIDRFDIIHAQFGQSGLLALPVTRPLIVTFHGSDLQGFLGSNGRYTVSGRILRLVSQFVAARSKRVIVVSEHLREHLPSQMRTEVIPCGVDFDLFHPMLTSEARRRLALPLNKCLVLFAANPFEPIKRHCLAQDAIELLKKEFDVDLVTICKVPHRMVPLYMNACDALVIASKHEGSPIVVKEALVCNLPVVSVDVGDVRQRIGGIEGCVLCEDDAPTTIAAGLGQVLRRLQRIQGRKAVSALEERKIAQKIIEVYRSVVNGKIQR